MTSSETGELVHPAGRPLRIAVIGTGYAAEHVRGYRALDDVEVAVVAAGHRASAERFAQEHGIPQVADSFEEAFAVTGLDAVSVASPPATHVEVVGAALARGLHVLCEKPLGRNATEAQRMLESARAAGVVHAVNYDYRVAPDLARLGSLVREGSVGRLRHAGLQWMADYHADGNVSWTWRNDRSIAGPGVLGDLNHAIDYVRWAFGEVDRVAADVRVCIERRPDPDTGASRPADTEDVASIVAVTVDGVPVSVQLSRCATGGGHLHVECYGSDGMLRMEMPDAGERSATTLTARRAGEPNGAPRPCAPSDAPVVTTEQAFVEAIRTGGASAPLSTFEDGLAVSRILDAIFESHDSGRWVEIDRSA
jgi:predicted dehydrogenase